MSSQLLRGAAGSVGLNVCSKALMLAASVLLARFLGASGFGAYSAAIALALVLATLGSLGLPTLLVRLVALYETRQAWGLMRGLLLAANRVVFGTTACIAAAGGAGAWLLSGAIGAELAFGMGCAMALVPLLALNALRSGALRGLHHVLLGQVPECLVLPSVFVAALMAWHASADAAPMGSGAAVALRVAATLAAFAAGAWFLLRRLPAGTRIEPPAYLPREWAASARPLLFIGAVSVVNAQTDVLMLAALRGAESAGVYQAAARGAELVAFSLMMANFALQPMISRLYAQGDMAELQRVVTLTTRLALALALPVALVLAAFAAPILGQVFGAGFERGAACLAILCGAQVLNAGMGSVDHLLNMTGHERDAAIGLALGAGANVALNAVLIPALDIEGAALATALSLGVWNVTLRLRVRRRLGIESSALGARHTGAHAA